MKQEKNRRGILKKSLTGDRLSLAFLMTACGMLFVYAFIQNPAEYTISRIGTQYPGLFFLTSFAMSFATACNLFRLFESVGLHSRTLTALTVTVNLAMIGASFTMAEEYIPGLTELHWIFALLFIVGNPLLLLIPLFKMIRNGNRRCLAAVLIFLPVYLLDALYVVRSFVLYGMMDGKNGVMELIPIFSTFLLLFLLNHTTLLEEPQIIPQKERAGR